MGIIAYGEQTVADVAADSPAARAGVRRGDVLAKINGAPVCDVVDYEYLTAEERLSLTLRGADGKERCVRVKKALYEPLGLTFATSLMDGMRTCRNRCIFCFIDQMPKGGRTSLHVKDDDWRLSFIMGNYVTLTNVDEAEFSRILARRVSPLYVSLHASDPKVRVAMMNNPSAGLIMERLSRLREAGLRFHLQIVLCPGVNDGDVLLRSIRDAAALMPAAQSLAIVPVGLTRYREGLSPLRCFTRAEADALIDRIEPVQRACLERTGTRFVFLSDEWYCMSGRTLPAYEAYEDFAQIENGVGLLRLFEHEFSEALADQKPLADARRFTMAGGMSAEPFFRPMLEKLAPYGVGVRTVPVENRYFGSAVTVAGLVTGGDLIEQLRGTLDTETLLIPRAMLRENDNVFLDNITVPEAEKALHARIVPVADGYDLIDQLFGSETE